MPSQTSPTVAPYGSWRSPVGVDDLTAGTVRLDAVRVDGPDLYWLESRPDQGGRTSLWTRPLAGGEPVELTPSPVNVRTRVNEYGGGEYGVRDGVVVYSDLADSRLWRRDRDGSLTALTAAGDVWFGDPDVHPDRGVVVAVREDRREDVVAADGQARTTLVAVPLDGSAAHDLDAVTVLAEGADFYSTPQLSAEGRLAWVQWDHPAMPWDATALRVARLGPEGLSGHGTVAGGPEESAVQPRWRGEDLLFVSDRTGWWNLYLYAAASQAQSVRAVHEEEAEFAEPQWVLGMTPYALLGPTDPRSRLLCQRITEGEASLVVVDVETGEVTPVAEPGVGANALAAGSGGAAAVLTSPDAPTSLAVLGADGSWSTVRTATQQTLAGDLVSIPRDVTWPGTEGVVHGWYYPPTNAAFVAPEGEAPPLITLSHGGPTSQSPAVFTLSIQYWTTRGFAVLDVNYGGSTGYGRPYRERLKPRWGVVDVEDCANGALAMVEQGLADRRRLAVKGGSAGGYTTLRALTATEVFTAGISSYGIGDLEVLARDTHKFESRYLDGLVGPYPEARDVYVERSPIHHVDRLSSPILLLQGLEDKVVPPNQAEAMADAARAKGLPVALILFEGEGHGFRRSETIVASYEAQTSFLAQVFGFTPADDIPVLAVENLS
ncbi:prolyl oligopeptidase family serine peptidase [Microlunatus flavus]|uniref:Dipeptidyl aminopeptidase/acylaminoacyl peptidase n=1 Tax=Microlunatus flavus TaxID=1036181 RepID=A0A1H9IHX5_9ACTN|nr:prolyl oligopeptidase family serine peptidase [Microlunatus flavus]SEQ74137.1 Dipeptidyl aminopeptidase/acylaminoacyl peptidase [Microlunatus flavus]